MKKKAGKMKKQRDKRLERQRETTEAIRVVEPSVMRSL